MRRSVRRWLLQRRNYLPPLILRTSWGDFAFKMRKTVDWDIRSILGEVDRGLILKKNETRELPQPNAETVADSPYWEYIDQMPTMREKSIDCYATQPMSPVG